MVKWSVRELLWTDSESVGKMWHLHDLPSSGSLPIQEEVPPMNVGWSLEVT